MDMNEWLKYGYEQGWVGPAVCFPHDGLPSTPEEDEDGDMCIHILRLYESPEQKQTIEENHSASVWRATNQGW